MIKKIIILLVFLLSGCYNYNELNDLAIATAIGIDYDSNLYQISIQVVNTKKKEETSFEVYEASGKTINEAIENLSLMCPKKIYLSHLEVLIYGEEMARHGINDTIDYFLRENSIRGDFNIFIARNNKANNIIKTNTPIYNINSENIQELNKSSYEKTGKSIVINFFDFADDYLNERIDIVLPSIVLEDEKLKINDLALFKGDKLIDYLNNNNIIEYNILKNNLKEATYTIKCQNGYMDILITNIVTNIKNNQINVNGDGKITSITCNLDLNDINKILNKKIEKNIKKLIKNSHDLDIDIIGFKDIAYKNKTTKYNNFNINININLISTGNTLKAVM